MSFENFKKSLRTTFGTWKHIEGESFYKVEKDGYSYAFSSIGEVQVETPTEKTFSFTVNRNRLTFKFGDINKGFSSDFSKAYVDFVSGQEGQSSLKDDIEELVDLYRKAEPISEVLTKLEEKVRG